MEVCKAILAAQRDHGNREVRANARMKYLVHSLGIDGFRSLGETGRRDEGRGGGARRRRWRWRMALRS